MRRFNDIYEDIQSLPPKKYKECRIAVRTFIQYGDKAILASALKDTNLTPQELLYWELNYSKLLQNP